MADPRRYYWDAWKVREPALEPEPEGQSRRFVEAAREMGEDLPEEAFDDALRRLGRAPARKGGKGKKGE